jgi:hypothetical protein
MQFVKGQKGYWAGKKRPAFSAEWRAKIGASNQGHIVSAETREKQRVGNLNKHNRPATPQARRLLSAKNSGNGNPFFGKTHSDESRRKIGIASRGRWSGSRNPKWRGGTARPNEIVRGSAAYKKWRRAVFERDNYACECGKRGGQLNAHHIKPFAFFPDLRFAVENDKTSCEPCHKQTETYGKPYDVLIAINS